MYTYAGERVAVDGNFIVFVFEIPALSVVKDEKRALECLISVLKKCHILHFINEYF